MLFLPVFTTADSKFGSCCCASALSLKRSFTGLPRFCLLQSGHFLRAEHGRQSLAGFGKWNVLSQKVPTQCLDEQEAQGGHILPDRGRSQLLGLEQMSLILPDLLGPELVRWLVKILRKIADDANVGFCGTMGVITALSF